MILPIVDCRIIFLCSHERSQYFFIFKITIIHLLHLSSEFCKVLQGFLREAEANYITSTNHLNFKEWILI
jgi:hypothetical protein